MGQVTVAIVVPANVSSCIAFVTISFLDFHVPICHQRVCLQLYQDFYLLKHEFHLILVLV
jgi:hypothetical protein